MGGREPSGARSLVGKGVRGMLRGDMFFPECSSRSVGVLPPFSGSFCEDLSATCVVEEVCGRLQFIYAFASGVRHSGEI